MSYHDIRVFSSSSQTVVLIGVKHEMSRVSPIVIIINATAHSRTQRYSTSAPKPYDTCDYYHPDVYETGGITIRIVYGCRCTRGKPIVAYVRECFNFTRVQLSGTVKGGIGFTPLKHT